jgi:hypothetical protein
LAKTFFVPLDKVKVLVDVKSIPILKLTLLMMKLKDKNNNIVLTTEIKKYFFKINLFIYSLFINLISVR